MDINKPLSPCVHSAMRSLPESVTSWEFAKYLLRIHPEYSNEDIQNLIPILDKTFEGDQKSIEEWLLEISKRYPNESLLHTGLVLVGLFHVDPSLHKLVPEDVIASIEKMIS